MKTVIYPNGAKRTDLFRVSLGEILTLYHHEDYINNSIRASRRRVVYYVVVEQTVDGQTSWVELEKNDQL